MASTEMTGDYQIDVARLTGFFIEMIVIMGERNGAYMPALATLFRIKADELADRFPKGEAGMHHAKEFVREDGQVHRAGMMDALHDDLEKVILGYVKAGLCDEDARRVLDELSGNVGWV